MEDLALDPLAAALPDGVDVFVPDRCLAPGLGGDDGPHGNQGHGRSPELANALDEAGFHGEIEKRAGSHEGIELAGGVAGAAVDGVR